MIENIYQGREMLYISIAVYTYDLVTGFNILYQNAELIRTCFVELVINNDNMLTLYLRLQFSILILPVESCDAGFRDKDLVPRK